MLTIASMLAAFLFLACEETLSVQGDEDAISAELNKPFVVKPGTIAKFKEVDVGIEFKSSSNYTYNSFSPPFTMVQASYQSSAQTYDFKIIHFTRNETPGAEIQSDENPEDNVFYEEVVLEGQYKLVFLKAYWEPTGNYSDKVTEAEFRLTSL